jgi:hypothetical protein
VNYSNRPIYRRRRRIAFLIIVVLLILVGLFLVGIIAGATGGEQTEQVGGPTVEQSSEATDEQTTG